MKYILIVIMVLSLNLSLDACIGQVSSGVSLGGSTSDASSEKNVDEGDEMKHEILTVKTIEESTLIALNEKDERYIISNYIQFGIDFETGQKIGISYLARNKNSDDEYELTGLKVTQEGPITIAPLEK